MDIDQIASSIVSKILIGVVLSAAMIISFFFLSRDLSLFLGRFENGDIFQLFIFSLLVIVTGIGLFLLFKTKKEIEPKEGPLDLSLAGLFSVDLKLVGFKFVEGFVSGLVKGPEKVDQVHKL